MNSFDNSPFRGPVGNIFLIGFMGSGKTYWGRKWAQQLNLDFFDLDELIEAGQEKTIAGIFEEHGEAYFRQLESGILRTFSGKTGFILACGGGTACFNDNMQWMNANGTTVYLSALPQTIYQRVLQEKDKRPLLKDTDRPGLLLFIEQKLKEREVFYNQAKMILPAEELNMESLQPLNL
ncbi:MAG: shikimate kinase [Chitinophagaceae bacterium]|nr:shikimate kinase [Chitinophagaceae bacterium]